MACGGSAINSIVAASSFGSKCHVAGKVSDDEHGNYFLKDLTNNGIYHSKLHSFTFENIIEPGDLDIPWAIEFLPDGQMLVTERDGRLWLISKSGKM